MSQPVSQNAHHRTDTDLLDRHKGLIPRVRAVQADVSDRFLCVDILPTPPWRACGFRGHMFAVSERQRSKRCLSVIMDCSLTLSAQCALVGARNTGLWLKGPVFGRVGTAPLEDGGIDRAGQVFGVGVGGSRLRQGSSTTPEMRGLGPRGVNRSRLRETRCCRESS